MVRKQTSLLPSFVVSGSIQHWGIHVPVINALGTPFASRFREEFHLCVMCVLRTELLSPAERFLCKHSSVAPCHR